MASTAPIVSAFQFVTLDRQDVPPMLALFQEAKVGGLSLDVAMENKIALRRYQRFGPEEVTLAFEGQLLEPISGHSGVKVSLDAFGFGRFQLVLKGPPTSGMSPRPGSAWAFPIPACSRPCIASIPAGRSSCAAVRPSQPASGSRSVRSSA